MSDLIAELESIWLPGEEHKYEIAAWPNEDVHVSFYTRGRWWHFDVPFPDGSITIGTARQIKSYIQANAILTTMHGS